jgi:hypothetical protein
MGDETALLVEAINGVKLALESLPIGGNTLEDLILPVGIVLLSAALGVGGTLFTIHAQEIRQTRLERLYASNDWILTVENMLQSLMAIKGNYSEGIDSHPYQRALHVRTLLGTSAPIEKSLANLSFIVPTEAELGAELDWRALSRINGLVKNYNLTIEIWNKRHEVERPLRQKLMSANGQLGYAHLTVQQIRAVLTDAELLLMIDLTEKAIHLTDDLIVEACSFLDGFPDAVAPKIFGKRRGKRHGLIRFQTKQNAFWQKMRTRCPEVNCAPLLPLYGVASTDEVREFYNNGYPQS